ncbi:recombinase RecT, partial [Proteus mirabilis]|uniref:recombinase RecT n=1 Tax=Proteus mirabilis TaxID=584 RepID=UPI00217CEFBA
MMIQGLDAGKKQGYFIPYGDEVQFQRSYFGTVTMLKRLPEINDIKAFEYYEDNVPEFEWDIQTMSLSKMKSWNPNHKSSELAGAFAVIYKNDGSFELTNMNIEEIHTSWSKSQNYGQTVWLNSDEEIKAAKAAGHKVKEGTKNGKTWAKYQ